MRLVCKEKGCYPIDCNEALQDDSDLYADGVHPNVQGYAKLAELIGTAFQQVLQL